MHFKNPEILYFLLLLVVPLLIHLFQLRKFKVEYFTNVQFLKQLNVQTRKSSKLKKYLLLVTRLFLLLFLIFAFAKPFFKSIDSKNASNELYIILDNSFSMQAKGSNGALLKRAIEDLIEKMPENLNFSLLTCSDNFWNTNIKSIQKELQNLDYSANEFDINDLLNKVNAHKSAFNKDVIVLSDAVGLKINKFKNNSNYENVSFIISSAQNTNNISIDSVFIKQDLANFYEISVKLTAFGTRAKNIPIALYNKNALIAKTIVDFNEAEKTVNFTIPKSDFLGYVAITDTSLNFDDTYYFGISKPKKCNVISIGEAAKSNFLSKIYSTDEFNYSNYTVSALDYNSIERQDAIVLNELEEIPVALQTTLKAYFQKGGTVVFIPNTDATVAALNVFLNNFGAIKVTSKVSKEQAVSKIYFDHPLFTNVFEKRIANFQYPTVKTFFDTNAAASQILGYANQSSFLSSVQKEAAAFYFFSAAINKDNCNFQNSPIIVPVFYKMAQNNVNSGVDAHRINGTQALFVATSLNKDAVLKVQNTSESFIPVQQIYNGKVKLTFNDNPKTAGNYSVINNTVAVSNLSFNYNRSESNLKNKSQINGNFKVESNFETVIKNLQSSRTDNQIWKWFVAAALLFLILEIFIQKKVS